MKPLRQVELVVCATYREEGEVAEVANNPSLDETFKALPLYVLGAFTARRRRRLPIWECTLVERGGSQQKVVTWRTRDVDLDDDG